MEGIYLKIQNMLGYFRFISAKKRRRTTVHLPFKTYINQVLHFRIHQLIGHLFWCSPCHLDDKGTVGLEIFG